MSQFGAGQTAGGAAYGAFQEAGVPYGYSSPFVQQFAGNHAEKAPFRAGTRRRLNGTAVCISFLAPWFLFTVVLGLLSFPIHYSNPGVVYLVVLLGLAAVASVGFYAYIHGKTQSLSPEREPSWLVFLTLSLAIAWVLGIAMGCLNYMTNTLPYQQMTHLNSYSDVDPSLMRGAQLMDAGSVVFAEGTSLDLNKSMGFKNQEVYCVAPIVKGEAQATYDFWAIGMGCCSGRKNDFHCESAKNPRARGALRLIPSADRPFYRLAVQQAEATHKIKATHPLFFRWVEDPLESINALRDAASDSFLTGMFSYLILQAFLVAAAALLFTRLGKS